MQAGGAHPVSRDELDLVALRWDLDRAIRNQERLIDDIEQKQAQLDETLESLSKSIDELKDTVPIFMFLGGIIGGFVGVGLVALILVAAREKK